MSEKLKYLFHIGGKKLQYIDHLEGMYDYQHLDVTDHLIKDLSCIQPMTSDQINNSSSLFLLSSEVMDKLNNIELEKLPSYQIFYEKFDGASEVEISVLKIKGAQKVDLSDGGLSFIQFVQENYVKPWGTSIDNSMVEMNSDFDGTVTKKGASMYMFNGEFGENYQQIMLWKNKWNASGCIKFYVEMDSSNDVLCYWRAYYKKNKNNLDINYKDFYIDSSKNEQIQFDLGYSEFPVNFGLFVKGKGKVEVGNIHIRSSLVGDNFLAMGGRRLVQSEHMGEELAYYFNAGDLKPPLNVYFSGFRPSEGYEGRWMMGSLGSPFILVYDPRLVGGSFYRGIGLEKELIKVIKDKLNILGFSNNELVLSGLSMGTYASFYYGSKLEPHAIVVGKPLANIGGLAVNSRIFSPYDWDLAMDTIIHLKGELTVKSAKKVDEEFWQQFKSADFSKTTFIIAHMLQDTDKPFKKIFNYLKKNYPTSKILHKGIEGRHNDDTSSVTSWFYKQYKQLLISDFNRQLVVEEEVENADLRGESDE